MIGPWTGTGNPSRSIYIEIPRCSTHLLHPFRKLLVLSSVIEWTESSSCDLQHSLYPLALLSYTHMRHKAKWNPILTKPQNPKIARWSLYEGSEGNTITLAHAEALYLQKYGIFGEGPVPRSRTWVEDTARQKLAPTLLTCDVTKLRQTLEHEIDKRGRKTWNMKWQVESSGNGGVGRSKSGRLEPIDACN